MVCPVCNGSGWVNYYDEEGRFYCKECSCGIRQAEIMKNRLKFADIPEAFKDEQLKNFRLSLYSKEGKEIASEACNVVKYWLDNLEEMTEKGKGLYFYSKAKGSGKTKIAVSIANELIHKYGKQVKFCTSMQIVNAIKDTWHDNESGSESKLLSDLGRTAYLIIDDFGTEQAKDWISEKFYSVINQRYVDKKVTIITSNYPIEKLPYDERIKDRISQICFDVPFPEESVRKVLASIDKQDLNNMMKRKDQENG